ncbi:MAG: flagellar basal body rod protein FlgC [Deltaproteobacteria bacterium]|nr:flagellar basal body rod protein FlgC [Deltaproteobacteria bacterium]
MDPFLPLRICATGLRVQRLRMDLIASNIANVNTTQTPQGGPYRRKDLLVTAVPAVSNFDFSDILEANLNNSLYKVIPISVIEDQRPFKVVYQPSHPDADKNGYVKLPNISPLEEMVNMISALRAYEANATVINNTKSMILKALEIGR